MDGKRYYYNSPKGRVVLMVTDVGTGKGKVYGTFYKVGMSWTRLNSSAAPMQKDREQAQADLDAFAKKHKLEEFKEDGMKRTEETEGTKETAVAVRQDHGDLRPYLEDREYDRGVFIRETRNYLLMTVEGMLGAGRRLICLKQMEPGRFLEALEEVGIPNQRANELMSITLFCTNHLLSKFPDSGNLKRLDTMGKTRLLLLSRIPEDVQAQFSGDDILGMTVDEVAAMPLDQLRLEVRELREQIKNGKLQVTRLQKDKTGLEEKVNGLLGKSSKDPLAAARIRAEKFFSGLVALKSMLNEEFKNEFDCPEKVAMLSASNTLFWQVHRVWEEIGTELGVPE